MSGPTLELTDSIVRAGAGAGKTTGLVERVVEVFRLYQRRQEWPRIVVTTFTRKATQELKERLILKACQEQDAKLLQFVTDPSRLQIATIHGLLNNFLKQLGHLAGMDAGFQIVNESEAHAQARLILRETVLAHPEGLNWLENYGFDRVLQMCRRFEQQWREHGQLATATLADLERVAQIETEIWKKTLTELAESLLEEVDEPKFVEFAVELKSFAASWTGDSADLENLPKKVRRSKTTAPYEEWMVRVEETYKAFDKDMGQECWNRTLWPQMIAAWNAFQPLGEDFMRRSLAAKDENAQIEIVDLELKTMEILREKPFLAEVFAESWDYWMIDEYQDTSPLQVACLTALIGGRPAYYVGDPQQSIYLFRGAEVRVFDHAEQEVKRKQGEVKELRRNYRSRPDLLLWINDFMASVGSDFRAMEPRSQAEPSTDEDDIPVTMLRAPDGETEMRAMVGEIGRLVGQGARLDQICILGRTHRTLMDASRALRAFGYPTHVHSARGFNTRREVMDAQAIWKFLVNPHDNLNLLVLLRSPWFYIEDAQLAEWMKDRPDSLWRRLEAQTAPHEAVERLRVARNTLAVRGLTRTFEETLDAAGMLDLSLVNDPAGRKESNLWKLVHRARALEREAGPSLIDFLSYEGSDPLEASEGDAASAQEPNSINLMTIHGSKGLQFEHVIVPRMGEAPQTSNTQPLSSDGKVFFFPLWNEETVDFTPSPLDFVLRRDLRRRELQEFDRWLYVAVTRAKKSLTLSWSKVEKNSWAERSAIFTRAIGVHQMRDYKFQIREEFLEPVAFAGSNKNKSEVREPWQSAAASIEERHSVTELIARGAVALPQEQLLRRWQAQNLGTRVHRSLEALKYGVALPEHSDAIRFVLGLTHPPMADLIENGEVEWGFQVQTPNGVVEGQIDLWAKQDGRIYLIDYKSGSEAYKESAFRQLSLYAWALRRFGHKEPADMFVIYPLSQIVEQRPVTEELLAGWELEFSRPKT